MKKISIVPALLGVLFSAPGYAIELNKPIVCFVGSFYESGQIATSAASAALPDFIVWIPDTEKLQRAFEFDSEGDNLKEVIKYQYQKKGSFHFYRMVKDDILLKNKWHKGDRLNPTWLEPTGEVKRTSDPGDSQSLALTWNKNTSSQYKLSLDLLKAEGRIRNEDKTGYEEAGLTCYNESW